jgi:hypothetical protein
MREFCLFGCRVRTLETVKGISKSRPPIKRNPNGCPGARNNWTSTTMVDKFFSFCVLIKIFSNNFPLRRTTLRRLWNFHPEVNRQFSIDRDVVVDWNCNWEMIIFKNSIRNSQFNSLWSLTITTMLESSNLMTIFKASFALRMRVREVK